MNDDTIIGRIEQLTETQCATIGLGSRRSVDLSPAPELLVTLYKALKLSGCWCTEPVWYAPKMVPIKCSRCRAIEEYERKYGIAA